MQKTGCAVRGRACPPQSGTGPASPHTGTAPVSRARRGYATRGHRSRLPRACRGLPQQPYGGRLYPPWRGLVQPPAPSGGEARNGTRQQIIPAGSAEQEAASIRHLPSQQATHFGTWTARDHSLPDAATPSQGGGGESSRGRGGVTPTGPEVPGAVAQDGRSRTSTSTVGCGQRPANATLWKTKLRNALEPFHRSSMRGTHRWVVSATHRPRRGCRDGFGEDRYTQNSERRC